MWKAVRVSAVLRTGTTTYTPESRSEVRKALSHEVVLPDAFKSQLESIKSLEEFHTICAYFFWMGSMVWVPLLWILAVVATSSKIGMVAALLAFLMLATAEVRLLHVAFLLLVLVVCTSTATVFLAVFTAVVLALSYWPVKRWPAFARSRMIYLMSKYHSFVIIYKEEHMGPLLNGGAAVLAGLPHGVMPVANILWLAAHESMWGARANGLSTRALTRCPILRHFMLWLGVKVGTRCNALGLIASGETVGVIPGGVAEIFFVNDKQHEVVFITSRKGFVRVALQSGAPIIPSYSFGNTEMFNCFYDEGGKLKALSRRLRFGFLPVWGRFGLPVPYRHKLWTVCGATINVPHVAEPTEEQINFYHSLYINQIKDIYETWAGAYGWKNRSLVIL